MDVDSRLIRRTIRLPERFADSDRLDRHDQIPPPLRIGHPQDARRQTALVMAVGALLSWDVMVKKPLGILRLANSCLRRLTTFRRLHSRRCPSSRSSRAAPGRTRNRTRGFFQINSPARAPVAETRRSTILLTAIALHRWRTAASNR